MAIAVSTAVIFPLFLTPILPRIQDAGAGPEASNTSVLDISALTGVPVFLERTAHIASKYAVILPPNPPPISIGVTLTWETGNRRILETVARTWNEPCVLVQMFNCPSEFQNAVVLCGSI